MPDPTIAPLHPNPETLAALTNILVEAVAAGASVSFMHPLPPTDAHAFWAASLAANRVILGATDGAALVGTVTLLLDLPPNQPHRGEIAKLMVRPSHRGRGIATALMRAAEAHAISRGRTLLVLDTAVDGGAAPLYEQLGYTLAGEIPDYALKPHGSLTGTLLYWKRIRATAA